MTVSSPDLSDIKGGDWVDRRPCSFFAVTFKLACAGAAS